MRQRNPTIMPPARAAGSILASASAAPAFGRRSAATQDGVVHSCSRLDFVRAATAGIIAEWQAAAPAGRPNILMRIRIAQDQISALRHNHPMMAERPSRYAWVDSWSPAE